MSRWNPCKHSDFIRRLRKIGFEGLYSGSKHQFMIFQQYRLTIPSNAEYSTSQLRMMLREVEEIIERKITIEEWDKLA
jgi:predicted RNA binding protein YcfA (HicA-like mRNA interferase family)